MNKLNLMLGIGILLFTFGCINYGRSPEDCGSDINCFRDNLEFECRPSTLSLTQQYGVIRLESTGPVWTDAVFGKDKYAPSRCNVKVQITQVNESAVPAAQKQQLQSAGVSISSITVADMSCIMTEADFYKVYRAKDKNAAKNVYNTCSGTLKLLADQVPALQEFMTN